MTMENPNGYFVKENPILFYLKMLLYMVIALLLRVICLLPLMCLTLQRTNPAFWLFLASPILMIFVVLPMRFSFADALVQKPRCRFFSLSTAFNVEHYGEKLVESLRHALSVLKWGIPMFAALGFAYYEYSQQDMITLLNHVKQLGGLFPFFGNALTGGIYGILIILGLCLLIWLFGAVRNSATRYIWVLATRGEKDPTTETRRRLRGRRLRQLGTALINLCLWIPFLAVAGLQLKDVISDLSTQMMLLLSHSATSIALNEVVLPMLLAFCLLYLPLLPVRRWLTARFATATQRKDA